VHSLTLLGDVDEVDIYLDSSKVTESEIVPSFAITSTFERILDIFLRMFIQGINYSPKTDPHRIRAGNGSRVCADHYIVTGECLRVFLV
jgi:hypothetical protein